MSKMVQWVTDLTAFPKPKEIPDFSRLRVPKPLLDKDIRTAFRQNTLDPEAKDKYIEGVRAFVILAAHSAIKAKLHGSGRIREFYDLVLPVMDQPTAKLVYEARATLGGKKVEFAKGGANFLKAPAVIRTKNAFKPNQPKSRNLRHF